MGVKLQLCGALVALIFSVLGYNAILAPHTATFELPPLLQKVVDACEQDGEGCNGAMYKFRAWQNLYILDCAAAAPYLPEGITLSCTFGKSLGAIFIVEYSHVKPDQTMSEPIREVDILQFAGNGPKNFVGAWATHVFLNSELMRWGGRQSSGLPVELAEMEVTHNCVGADRAITFTVNDDTDEIESVQACLPGGPGEGWMDLTTLTNHSLPNLTGKLPLGSLGVKSSVLPHGPTGLGSGLGNFMMYLFTFLYTEVKLATAIDQRVVGAGKGAAALRALVSGPVIPVATIFDKSEVTLWDTAELNPDTDAWEMRPELGVEYVRYAGERHRALGIAYP